MADLCMRGLAPSVGAPEASPGSDVLTLPLHPANADYLRKVNRAVCVWITLRPLSVKVIGSGLCSQAYCCRIVCMVRRRPHTKHLRRSQPSTIGSPVRKRRAVGARTPDVRKWQTRLVMALGLDSKVTLVARLVRPLSPLASSGSGLATSWGSSLVPCRPSFWEKAGRGASPRHVRGGNWGHARPVQTQMALSSRITSSHDVIQTQAAAAKKARRSSASATMTRTRSTRLRRLTSLITPPRGWSGAPAQLPSAGLPAPQLPACRDDCAIRLRLRERSSDRRAAWACCATSKSGTTPTTPPRPERRTAGPSLTRIPVLVEARCRVDGLPAPGAGGPPGESASPGPFVERDRRLHGLLRSRCVRDRDTSNTRRGHFRRE